MTLEAFQDEANRLIERLHRLVEQNLLKKGDKIEDCQQTALLAAIEHVRRNVTGVFPSDMRLTNTIKVSVMGYNHGGIFDVFCCTLVVTDEQRDNNVHLDVAEELAKLFGIEDVRVRFDDADSMGAPILALYLDTGRIIDLSNLDDTGIDEWLLTTAADAVQEACHSAD